jgi:hypothetical protein
MLVPPTQMNFLLARIGAPTVARTPATVVIPALLALVMEEVAVACRCPRELGSAVGTGGLRRLARFFPLMAEEIAKGRKLPSVAAVFPTLGLGPALYNPDVGAIR